MSQSATILFLRSGMAFKAFKVDLEKTAKTTGKIVSKSYFYKLLKNKISVRQA